MKPEIEQGTTYANLSNGACPGKPCDSITRRARTKWFCSWLSDGSKAGRALTFRPESARSVLMRSSPKNRGSSGMLLFLANALTQDLVGLEEIDDGVLPVYGVTYVPGCSLRVCF